MPELSEIRNASFNHLGKDAILRGEFILGGEVQIFSQLEGILKAKDENTYFSFGPTSVIRAEVHGHDMEIFGHFQGKIVSRGLVIIHACATFEGEIDCERLVIYPGAIVDMQGQTALDLS